MSSGVLRCADGEVHIAADGAPLCSGVWTLVPVPEPFSPEQIDMQTAGLLFGAGFTIVMTFALLGFGGRAMLDIFKHN